ncbi:MAG TPA: hypothetical protein VFO94_02960 [Gammaproteobacteria bacterium]|nr:hypothetical protein [Gammaproteobacteria bacterium]
MRKPKEHDEETDETQFFDDFESDDGLDDDDDSHERDPRKSKKPARQRVELRNEQQSLRRQLSDWDDYEQDDYDTKL